MAATRRSSDRSASLQQYLREMEAYPPLTKRERDEIDEAIRAGDAEARSRLASGSLRYVVQMATFYERVSHADLDELIEVGNIGLMKAVQKYDPDYDNGFLSYARWWIKNSILQFLGRSSGDVRVSQAFRKHVKRLKKEEKRRTAKGLPRLSVQDAAELLETTQETARHVVEWVAGSDEPTPDDPDILADESAVDLDVLEGAQREGIRQAFEDAPFTERERQVLTLLCGLGGEPAMSYREIGERLGVTHQAISQTVERARKRMLESSDTLHKYWEDYSGTVPGMVRVEQTSKVQHVPASGPDSSAAHVPESREPEWLEPIEVDKGDQLVLALGI